MTLELSSLQKAVILLEGAVKVATSNEKMNKLDKIFYALKEDFEESDLPFRVDVLDWNRISDEFKKVISKQYEIIQKAKAT
ncbi:MAG: hypothetical protein J7M11_00360 [Elusimicrobia bacterium]|nr:hypothetical protein [Elusimicrobiota bacterium]